MSYYCMYEYPLSCMCVIERRSVSKKDVNSSNEDNDNSARVAYVLSHLIDAGA